MSTQSLYKTPAGEKAVMEIYDAALAHWPVAYETRTLATRHGDTFVIKSGEPSSPARDTLCCSGGTDYGVFGAGEFVPESVISP